MRQRAVFAAAVCLSLWGGAAALADSGTFGGNHNYIIDNDGDTLVDPFVEYTALSDVVADGNWDMQVNVYSEKGTSAYTQFVMAVTSSGEIQWSIEDWRVSGPNIFNTCDHHLYQLRGNSLPAGDRISESFESDDSGNVVAVTFRVSSGKKTLAKKRVPLDASLPICDPGSFSWDDSYLFAPVALEANISGYNGGVAVQFSTATAVLAYSAKSGVDWSADLPDYTETKAQTVETSNELYGEPTGSADVLTQQCAVDADTVQASACMPNGGRCGGALPCCPGTQCILWACVGLPGRGRGGQSCAPKGGYCGVGGLPCCGSMRCEWGWCAE